MRSITLSFGIFLIFNLTTALAADRAPSAQPPVRPTKILGGGVVDKTKTQAVSAHGVFVGRFGKPGTVNQGAGAPAAINVGPEIQDVSVQVSGPIDNNFSGTVALHNFASLATLTAPGLDLVREAYGKTMTIPVLSFKMGKFLLPFGIYNQTYPHALPMVDFPLISTELFGSGFSSIGAQMDIEIPLPWRFNLYFAAVSAAMDGSTFRSANNHNVTGVGRMEHEFDVSSAVQMGFGISAATGKNASTNDSTFLGGDFSLRYKGDGTGFGFAWLNEFIYAKRVGLTAPLANEEFGFNTMPLFRVSPAFWVGARFDFVNRESINDKLTRESAMIAWVPSDTSTLRLQGGFGTNDVAGNTWSMALQYNMTLGGHPGHAY